MTRSNYENVYKYISEVQSGYLKNAIAISHKLHILAWQLRLQDTKLQTEQLNTMIWYINNNNNNDRLTAFDPGQPG